MDLTQLLTLAANSGVAVTIAIYLVWWVTKKVSNELGKITRKLNTINLNTVKLIERINRVIEELETKA